MRGMITEKIQAKAKELLGINKLSVTELRLMPYVQYCLMNPGKYDRSRVDDAERKIMHSWSQKGWVRTFQKDLATTEEFWKALNEILWLAYVTPVSGDFRKE